MLYCLSYRNVPVRRGSSGATRGLQHAKVEGGLAYELQPQLHLLIGLAAEAVEGPLARKADIEALGVRAEGYGGLQDGNSVSAAEAKKKKKRRNKE
jgi:hypothetical protein